MRVKASESSNRFARANIGFHLFRNLILPLLPQEAASEMRAPVVIGALGGSGTRVLPSILRDAGYWMGAWVNPKTEDAMATRYFLQRYFRGAVCYRAENEDQLRKACSSAITAHRWGMPDKGAPWGWKNPRCMWVIPFLVRVYPEMKFIHVVRDGRDMALTNNNNLLRKHGHFLLNPDDAADPINAQLQLWTTGNRRAYDDANTHLGANYLRIKYEDMCLQPHATLARLFAHLDLDVTDTFIDESSRMIRRSRSIGMWRESDIPILHAPDDGTRATLRLLGYDADDPAPASKGVSTPADKRSAA